MKRRLFNVLAAMSLVLCVATAALWMRSHVARDDLYWTNSSRNYVIAISSSRGQLAVSIVRITSGIGQFGSAGLHYEMAPPRNMHDVGVPDDFDLQVAGFFVKVSRPLSRPLMSNATGAWVSRWFVVAVPAWLLLAVFSVPPIAWVRYRLKHRASAVSSSSVSR